MLSDCTDLRQQPDAARVPPCSQSPLATNPKWSKPIASIVDWAVDGLFGRPSRAGTSVELLNVWPDCLYRKFVLISFKEAAFLLDQRKHWVTVPNLATAYLGKPRFLKQRFQGGKIVHPKMCTIAEIIPGNRGEALVF